MKFQFRRRNILLETGTAQLHYSHDSNIEYVILKTLKIIFKSL